MAGVTLTVQTRADVDYKSAVSSAAAGSPSVGEPQFVYDDTETQDDLLNALEKAKQHVMENVSNR